MKSFRKELWFDIPTRRAFINITPQVEEALKERGITEGLCLINAMHITASVYINDDERGLLADYEEWLEELAPHEPIPRYRHNNTGKEQRRRSPETADHGARGRRGRHRRTTRLRLVGADLLRRIRRSSSQTRARQDHRRVRL